MASNSKIHAPILELSSKLPAVVTFHKAQDGGFWVDSPSFPNCFAAGDNLADASKNFKFALFDYFDVPKRDQKEEALIYQVLELTDSAASNKEEKTASLVPSPVFVY